MASRLRAVLTPQALIVIVSLMAASWFLFGAANADAQTALEKRISQTLSSMDGAGSVRVVIATRAAQGKTTGLGMGSASEEQIPCGAVAVAAGADDPLIQAKITQALCALLGLPASAVSVVSGGG